MSQPIDEQKPRVAFKVVGAQNMGALTLAAAAALTIEPGVDLPRFDVPPTRGLPRRSRPNSHHAPPREQGARERARRLKQAAKRSGGSTGAEP